MFDTLSFWGSRRFAPLALQRLPPLRTVVRYGEMKNMVKPHGKLVLVG